MVNPGTWALTASSQCIRSRVTNYSLHCFVTNWNSTQVIHGVDFKPCGGLTGEDEGYDLLITPSNIFSLAVPEWIRAAKNSVERLGSAPWKQTVQTLDLALSLYTRSHSKYIMPSFLLLTSAPAGSPWSKRPRTRSTTAVKSRGKPQDRWLSRKGNRHAERVSDVNDSTEKPLSYFLSRRKIQQSYWVEEYSSVL